jgi:hypothetical protein
MIKTVLDWPNNQGEVYSLLDEIIAQSTAVDGVTGEKGLTGYTTIGPRGVAELLGMYSRIAPTVLRDMFQRHPQLRQTYRFHMDAWCMQKYYPTVGDCGAFGRQTPQYVGVSFSKHPGLSPSMYTFMQQMYELTGDAAFVQALYHANGDAVDGLPYDLFADNPSDFQERVRRTIEEKGTLPEPGGVNKEKWRLAILRSKDCAAWLAYDSGGRHGHANGMNLGLFAKGLDLTPDFGYPPVQYGGWDSPRANWYKMTASHNTVVVDGKNHRAAAGETTLWADGKQFHAIRASGKALIEGEQFERTVALIDAPDSGAYIVDVFRVVGGVEHAKFMHSHFGQINVSGLNLRPAVPLEKGDHRGLADDYGRGAQMRNFLADFKAQPGWRVDWKIEDRYGYLPPESDVHLRYTDLTADAEAFTSEGWVSVAGFNRNEEAWIPFLMIRRRAAEAPLASTFVSVIEPYESVSKIHQIRRLSLETERGETRSDADVALEIQFTDGRQDMLIAIDVERAGATQNGAIVQRDWNLQFDGELCWARRNQDGAVCKFVACNGRSIRVGEASMVLKQKTDYIELNFTQGSDE